MHAQDLLPALLGPVGTLVFSLVVIWAFVTEKIVPKRRLDEVIELLQKSHEQAREGVSLTAEAIREQVWKAEIEHKLENYRKAIGAPPSTGDS